MYEALKKNVSIIKANNSSYGNFVFEDERYFFKLVNKDDFIRELNGYLETVDNLKTKRLVRVFNDVDDYYIIYEYDKLISKNNGLINDVFTDYEYNKKTYDKDIFTNLINSYRQNYRNLKLLECAKNDCFFQERLKSRLIEWYKNDPNFTKPVSINYIDSTTTKNIIEETLEFFTNLDKKMCFISGGDPNTFNLSTEGTFYDLATAGYNDIQGELAITFISHLITDAYLAPKYNKNSYTNHDLIYEYRNSFKPTISYKNNNKIYINSNIISSSIRKKYIRDYLLMLKEENVPINENIKYYLAMRILTVFNIENFNKTEYYYSIFLLHFIYNNINENALDSLINLLDYIEEI